MTSTTWKELKHLIESKISEAGLDDSIEINRMDIGWSSAIEDVVVSCKDGLRVIGF